MGFAALFLQSDPRIENAILACQSVADGGARPDSSTENAIKSFLYGSAAVVGVGVTPGPVAQTGPFGQPAIRGLLQIEQAIANLDPLIGVLRAEDATLDTAREGIRLKMEGRRICNKIARMLGMRGVRADIFSSAPVMTGADPWGYASDPEYWKRP